MSTQHHNHTVPITYTGYATCDQCQTTFYQEQPNQTICNLCVVGAVFDHRKTYRPSKRTSTEPITKICSNPDCGVEYTPARPKISMYCSAYCRSAVKVQREREAR